MRYLNIIIVNDLFFTIKEKYHFSLSLFWKQTSFHRREEWKWAWETKREEGRRVSCARFPLLSLPRRCWLNNFHYFPQIEGQVLVCVLQGLRNAYFTTGNFLQRNEKRQSAMGG